jgi:hypothetical protein
MAELTLAFEHLGDLIQTGCGSVTNSTSTGCRWPRTDRDP